MLFIARAAVLIFAVVGLPPVDAIGTSGGCSRSAMPHEVTSYVADDRTFNAAACLCSVARFQFLAPQTLSPLAELEGTLDSRAFPGLCRTARIGALTVTGRFKGNHPFGNAALCGALDLSLHRPPWSASRLGGAISGIAEITEAFALARHPKSAESCRPLSTAALTQTFRNMGTPYECEQAVIH
jgi:hypothetical protein